MTYADTATALRRELSELLIEADVVHTRGPRPLSAADSLLVQQFRATILTWISRSTVAVVPDEVSRSDWQWGPARLFADHLNRIVVPTLTLTPPAVHPDLGTPSDNATVERWRRAAVTATIGLDRELRLLTEDPTALKYAPGRTREQEGINYLARLRVVDDNAALAHALILLDTRVGGRPGWHHLGGLGAVSPLRQVSAEGLLSAVELCRRWARAHDLPTSVDHHGYRRAPALIPGPVEPGMTGLYAAVHNTAIRLQDSPRGDVMGQLVRSQRALTHGLLEVLPHDDPSLAALFARRQRYDSLALDVRSLGGRVGAGPDVLIDSEQARGVLTTVEDPRPADVAKIVSLFTTIDTALADHLRRGIHERTYVQRVGRHLSTAGAGGVRLAADEWTPYTGQARTDLLQAARDLTTISAPRPPQHPPRASLVVGPTREMFDETLTAATPARTAATGPLAGAPARTILSRDVRRQLNAASAEPIAVQEALRDYLMRRPISGGGASDRKGHGREPGDLPTSTQVEAAPGHAGPARTGRDHQDREVGPATRPGFTPSR